jgi:hypothetical protein
MLTKVDITNPLKIFTFFMKISILCNFRQSVKQEIQKVNFNQVKIDTNKCAGLSGQNKIWTFDSNTQQIGLYDLNTNTYKTLEIR